MTFLKHFPVYSIKKIIFFGLIGGLKFFSLFFGPCKRLLFDVVASCNVKIEYHVSQINVDLENGKFYLVLAFMRLDSRLYLYGSLAGEVQE